MNRHERAARWANHLELGTDRGAGRGQVVPGTICPSAVGGQERVAAGGPEFLRSAIECRADSAMSTTGLAWFSGVVWFLAAATWCSDVRAGAVVAAAAAWVVSSAGRASSPEK